MMAANALTTKSGPGSMTTDTPESKQGTHAMEDYLKAISRLGERESTVTDSSAGSTFPIQAMMLSATFSHPSWAI